MKMLFWASILISTYGVGQVYVPGEIDGTGNSDVTEQLNTFLQHVSDSSRIIFPHRKIFRVEGTLKVLNKKHVIIDGNDSELVSNTLGNLPAGKKKAGNKKLFRNRFHLTIEHSRDITVKRLKITGANKKGGIGAEAYQPGLEAQHGINIFNSSNVFIDSVHVGNVYGDGVYIGDGAGNRSSDTIVITRSIFHDTGRQGIAMTYCNFVVLDSCKFYTIRRSHIDLETNTNKASVKNVIITNCTFGVSRLNWISGVGAGNTMDIYILKNKLINKPGMVTLGSLRAENFGPYYFIGNSSTTPGGNPLGAIWRLTNVKGGFYAYNNEIVLQKGRDMHLVLSYKSENIDLVNNTVLNGQGDIITKTNNASKKKVSFQEKSGK